jgi:hypothetical protein
MTRLVAVVLLAIPFSFTAASSQPAKPKSDIQIKQEIIKTSIAAYRGSCPCPFNTDRAGLRCGARSAYCRFSEGRDPSFSKPFPPDLSSRVSAHHTPSGCPKQRISVYTFAS